MTIHTGTLCQQCSRPFHSSAREHEFYHGMKIPKPTFCPTCRLRRRLFFWNDHMRYARTCDRCKEKIISLYAPDHDAIVYCEDCFYSDAWDPLDYGKPYDFKKPFFLQWLRLQKSIPHLALPRWEPDPKFLHWYTREVEGQIRDALSEESTEPHRATHIEKSENSSGHILYECEACEHCFIARNCEGVSYGMVIDDIESSMDATYSFGGHRLYEVIGAGEKSENVRCSVRVAQSTRISYSYLLENCSDCFGCINLRDKSFCVLNYQYSPQEYHELLVRVHAPHSEVDQNLIQPRIITHMNAMPFIDRHGRTYRYGDFFPGELSPFEFQETAASAFFTPGEQPTSDAVIEYLSRHHELYERFCANCRATIKSAYLKTEIPNVLCEKCYHNEYE